MTKLFDHRASSFFPPILIFLDFSCEDLVSPPKFNRVRPLKMDAAWKQIRLPSRIRPMFICKMLKFWEICTSKALLKRDVVVLFFLFFGLGNRPVDVKVSSDFFSLGFIYLSRSRAEKRA